MTEEVQILVTVQVDNDEDKPLSAKDKLSAVEAIRHAVKHMEGAGFVHSRADKLSIGVVMVENVTGAELGAAVDDAASIIHTQLATDIEETKKIKPISDPRTS